MLNRAVPLLFLVACCAICSAQQRQPVQEPVIEKVTLYYDGAAELTSPEKASKKRIVEMNLHAMAFNGVYQDFDMKDKLLAEGYFHEGHKQGLLNEYFSDRSLKSTIDFLENDFVIWQLKNDAKEDLIVNGTGKFSLPFYYGTGTKLQPRWKQGTMEGEFQFGKRAGRWLYFDLVKNKLDEEVYEKGKFINRIHYDATDTIELDYRKELSLSLGTLLEEVFAYDQQTYGNLYASMVSGVHYPSNLNRQPTFAGGIKRLLLLMAKRVMLPDGSGMVVRLSINENGMITSSTVQPGVSRQADAAILDVIKVLDKKFLPAIKKGKPYASVLHLPIFGGEEGLKLIEALPYDFVEEEY